jgi:hypothetical protein
MEFTYTRHARQRMLERGISEEEVEECVRGATNIIRSEGRNPKYRADVGGRRIKVVVAADQDDDVKRIVSVMAEEET